MTVYLNVENQTLSYAWGPAFLGGLSLCMWMMVKAAGRLAY